MIIQRFRTSTLLLTLLFLLSTCKKGHELDCFTSTGNMIFENRPAKAIKRIDLKDDVDIVLKRSSVPYLRVSAGEHLIDGIITEISGTTLYIRDENRCKWMRSFKNTCTVYIGIDSLEQISSYGSGNISCVDSLHSEEFTFDSWNASGDIRFLFNCHKTHINNNIGRINASAAGSSGVSFVYINDVGVFDGSELATDLTYIHNKSTGNCFVNVGSVLEAEISSSGNIYYSGNPSSIKQTGSGTGGLFKN